MEDLERVRLFRKKRIRPYRGRGEVYSWLRAHHDRVAELVPTWAWAELVQEMLRDGMRGRDGVTPTPKAVTKVWQRVQRDVEVNASAVQAKPTGGKYPSRISSDWRPEVVPQPPPSAAGSGSALVSASRPAWTPPPASVAGRPAYPLALAEPEIIRDAKGVPYDEASQAKLREMRARLFGELEKSDRGKFGP